MFDRIKNALNARFARRFTRDGEDYLYHLTAGRPQIRLSGDEFRLSEIEFQADAWRLILSVASIILLIALCGSVTWARPGLGVLVSFLAFAAWLDSMSTAWMDLWDGPVRVAAQNRLAWGEDGPARRKLLVLRRRHRGLAMLPIGSFLYIWYIVRNGVSPFDWVFVAFLLTMGGYILILDFQKSRTSTLQPLVS
jgi:hypothetical protein